jgi:hypothetical protein
MDASLRGFGAGHEIERLSILDRSSPSGIETEMREYLMPKLGQMRIAAMAGIRACVDDLGLDVRGARSTR